MKTNRDQFRKLLVLVSDHAPIRKHLRDIRIIRERGDQNSDIEETAHHIFDFEALVKRRFEIFGIMRPEDSLSLDNLNHVILLKETWPVIQKTVENIFN